MLKNLNWKKLLLVLGFIVLVIIFGYGLYYFFFRQVLPKPIVNVNENANQKLPVLTNGNQNIINQNYNGGLPDLMGILPENLSKVAKGGPTLANKLNANNALPGSLLMRGSDLYYYNEADGKFYKIGANGERQVLDNKIFYNVDKVNWSPKGDKAILEYPDGSNILYNFATNQQTTLLKELSEFAFDNSGENFVSELVTDNEDSNWLVTASPDGSNMKYLEPLGKYANEVETGWSADHQIIAINTKGANISSQEIYLVGQNNENIPYLNVQGRGFESNWSPSDNTLLYSVYNQNSGYRPTLYIAKTGVSGTSAVFNTGLNTWSDKCTYSASMAYCAVPIGLDEYSGLHPEISQNNFYNFYQIDLNSGSSALLGTPVGSNGQFFNVENIVLSADGNYIYFSEGNANGIYSLQIN